MQTHADGLSRFSGTCLLMLLRGCLTEVGRGHVLLKQGTPSGGLLILCDPRLAKLVQ